MPPRPRSSPTNAHRRTLELGHRVLSRLQRREVREALPGELHFVFSRLVARRSSLVARHVRLSRPERHRVVSYDVAAL